MYVASECPRQICSALSSWFLTSSTVWHVLNCALYSGVKNLLQHRSAKDHQLGLVHVIKLHILTYVHSYTHTRIHKSIYFLLVSEWSALMCDLTYDRSFWRQTFPFNDAMFLPEQFVSFNNNIWTYRNNISFPLYCGIYIRIIQYAQLHGLRFFLVVCMMNGQIKCVSSAGRFWPVISGADYTWYYCRFVQLFDCSWICDV